MHTKDRDRVMTLLVYTDLCIFSGGNVEADLQHIHEYRYSDSKKASLADLTGAMKR